MARKDKPPMAKQAMPLLIGEIVLMRSSVWLNGRRQVAALVTGMDLDQGLIPENAMAVVSLTAFPPGAPSRIMQDVPLYQSEPAADVLPAAWLKAKC